MATCRESYAARYRNEIRSGSGFCLGDESWKERLQFITLVENKVGWPLVGALECSAAGDRVLERKNLERGISNFEFLVANNGFRLSDTAEVEFPYNFAMAHLYVRWCKGLYGEHVDDYHLLEAAPLFAAHQDKLGTSRADLEEWELCQVMQLAVAIELEDYTLLENVNTRGKLRKRYRWFSEEVKLLSRGLDSDICDHQDKEWWGKAHELLEWWRSPDTKVPMPYTEEDPQRWRVHYGGGLAIAFHLAEILQLAEGMERDWVKIKEAIIN